MKGNELVWRALSDAALSGRRTWANIGDIAFAAGVPPTTAHYAIQRLADIGAVTQHPRGGLSTVNPEKVLTLLVAWRNVAADTVALTTVDAIRPDLASTDGPYALGGADAAIVYLDGWNNIADRGQRLIYVSGTGWAEHLEPGEEVRLVKMDERAQREWTSGFASLAQTCADLFATPGWQSEEFRKALWRRYLRDTDREQPGYADE